MAKKKSRSTKKTVKPTKKKWLWEFSKRVVVACTLLYFVGNIVSMVVMVKFQDFSSLGTFLDNLGTMLQVCVFGYFVKAGVENAFKIKTNSE